MEQKKMKPTIICYMISSVDGRLQLERYSKMFTGVDIQTVEEIYLKEGLQFSEDGWLLGRKSIQEHHIPEEFDHSKFASTSNASTYIAPRKSARALIIIDPKGRINYPENQLMGDDIIAVVGESVSEEYLEMLRAMEISYAFAGSDGYDMEKALETLYNEFGMKRLLLEGGGNLNGSFLKARYIDELALVVYPGIDGLAGIPSVLEYAGQKDELPADGQTLELLSVKELAHGVVWLHYKIHTQR